MISSEPEITPSIFCSVSSAKKIVVEVAVVDLVGKGTNCGKQKDSARFARVAKSTMIVKSIIVVVGQLARRVGNELEERQGRWRVSIQKGMAACGSRKIKPFSSHDISSRKKRDFLRTNLQQFGT